MNIKNKASKIAAILCENNPNPKTELNHENEYQLAVAVMLSAQTTDKKVNEVTPRLFSSYPDWKSLGMADVEDVRRLIRGVNFHVGKGERLVRAGKLVTEEFAGKLPNTMRELLLIPGVARKSANVIMQELWDIAEGIVVDTHVSRVSNRLGLTAEIDPKKIEKDLMNIIPKDKWRCFSGSCVLHGRYVCKARKPNCCECILSIMCPSNEC